MSAVEKLILIGGPTASGKTGLSLELANRLGGAIISADSRMVYRGLDIGTGKPTWEYREYSQSPWLPSSSQAEWGPVYMIQGIEHHVLDVVDPETPWTLTDWLAAARSAITDIRRRALRPIVVGGTGLYLKALMSGYEPPPTDSGVREAIECLSIEEIIQELEKIDPETAQREQANRRRLVRALEVARVTGKAMSQIGQQRVEESHCLAISRPRDSLYTAIDTRTNLQLEQGLVEEIRSLLRSGISSTWLRQIGLEYRIVVDWLEIGGNDEDRLRRTLQGAIHAYARRQLTFLRTQIRPTWVDPEEDITSLLGLLK